VPAPAAVAAVNCHTRGAAKAAPLLFCAAVVTTACMVSPGRKLTAPGLKVMVLPLTVAGLAVVRNPPRWALNTFSAPAEPALKAWSNVAVMLLVRAAATALAAGATPVSSSGAVTVKVPTEVAVPPGVATAMAPVLAPLGTVVVICVGESTVKVVAAVPLNFTAVAPVKLVPVMTTLVLPATPLPGEKPVIVGGPLTVNNTPLLAMEVP
jgi:hypothetical protein